MLYVIAAAVALAIPASRKFDKFFSRLLTVVSVLAFLSIIACAVFIHQDAALVNPSTGAI